MKTNVCRIYFAAPASRIVIGSTGKSDNANATSNTLNGFEAPADARNSEMKMGLLRLIKWEFGCGCRANTD